MLRAASVVVLLITRHFSVSYRLPHRVLERHWPVRLSSLSRLETILLPPFVLSNHGRCQITINGRDNGTVATFGDFGLPMRHFQRSGLNPESEQTIVITVVGADDSGMMGNVCSIDRFV